VTRILCVLLLLVGVSSSAAATPSGNTLSSIILIARAGLPDANFNGSTVLVTNRIASGPFGIIVNRPTRLTVSQLFPDWKKNVHGDEKVYFGGPVDVTSVSFLFQSRTPRERAVEVLAGVYLSRDLDLLRTLLERDNPNEAVRVFIGYAGWEPDQLEAEIAGGNWKVAPASTGAIFEARPEHPWPEPPAPEARRI